MTLPKPLPSEADEPPFWRRKAMSEMTKAECSKIEGTNYIDANPKG